MLLLALAAWETLQGLLTADPVEAALNEIGPLIIGSAVVETANFIAEEEFVRRVEKKNTGEELHRRANAELRARSLSDATLF